MASFLPHESIVGILSCLPVKSLIRFKCVGKGWLDLIKSSSFVQNHLQRATENGNFNLMSNDDGHVYSIGYDTVALPVDEVEQIAYPLYTSRIIFLGSCNGLICLFPDLSGDNRYGVVCLWNPATKEATELPNGYYSEDYGYPIEETCGFGYDCKTKDYKVVKIVCFYKEYTYHLTIVKVYTLGSNSWRRIEDIPYVLTHKSSPGICVSGALHWVAKRGNMKKLSSNEEVIMSIDLGDEEYREVPQPDYLDNSFDMNVGVLEGSLCVIRTDRSKTHVDLWLMEKYGVRESWKKLLTVTQSMGIHEKLLRLTPIKILKNGEILLNSCGLMLYDPRSKRVRRFETPGDVRGVPWFDAVAYVSSLISLNSDKYFWPKGEWKKSLEKCSLQKDYRGEGATSHIRQRRQQIEPEREVAYIQRCGGTV